MFFIYTTALEYMFTRKIRGIAKYYSLFLSLVHLTGNILFVTNMKISFAFTFDGYSAGDQHFVHRPHNRSKMITNELQPM